MFDAHTRQLGSAIHHNIVPVNNLACHQARRTNKAHTWVSGLSSTSNKSMPSTKRPSELSSMSTDCLVPISLWIGEVYDTAPYTQEITHFDISARGAPCFILVSLRLFILVSCSTSSSFTCGGTRLVILVSLTASISPSEKF